MNDMATQVYLKDEQAITLKNEERTKCEVWTRVMGYHRPYASFNIGKKGEYNERKCFNEAKANLCC
jgi:hypothetical protein